MRRSRAIYFGVIGAVILAVGITVGIVWAHGETAHSRLHTAGQAAPSVALQSLSATQQRAWQSADRSAIGTPYWGGTVVTYTADSVRGRNAATGKITWSYTRTDRTVCQAIQDQGITVAVFELNGNCDQVTGLDSGTGERRWDRTLDKAEGQDSQPLNGRPTYSVSQNAVMLTTSRVIYAVDPVSGLDRWAYHPEGCAIHGAVIGTAGALISQTCVRPKCDGIKFCGPGVQLLLRDAGAPRNEDDKTNPDRIIWNQLGTNAVPASADQRISAVDSVLGQLEVFGAAHGAPIARLALTGGLASSEGIAALEIGSAELLWISGTTYAVNPAGTKFLWTAPTPAPPTVTPLSEAGLPDLRASTIAVASAAGIALLEPGTGKTARTIAVAAPPAGSVVYPFGTGFVVAGPSTTVYR